MIFILVLITSCVNTQKDIHYAIQVPLQSAEADREFKKAKALGEIGDQKQANRIILSLAKKGYQPALKSWVPKSSCYRVLGTRNDEPDWSVAKLAMQGDKDSIYKYWECVSDSDGYDVDVKAGLFLLEYLANKRDRTAIEYLISYHISYLSVSPMTSKIYEPETLRCGKSGNVRQPNIPEAERWINIYQAEADMKYKNKSPYLHIWAFNYSRLPVLIANYYANSNDYLNAEKWYKKGLKSIKIVESWRVPVNQNIEISKFIQKKLNAIQCLL